MTDTGIHKYFYEEAWTCLLFVYVLFPLYILFPLCAVYREEESSETRIGASHREAQIHWEHPSESFFEKHKSGEGDFRNQLMVFDLAKGCYDPSNKENARKNLFFSSYKYNVSEKAIPLHRF